MRRAATARAHFECVPGMQTTPEKPGLSAASPSNWVSSPRITLSEPGTFLAHAGQDGRRQSRIGHVRMNRAGEQAAQIGRRFADRALRASPAERRPCRRSALASGPADWPSTPSSNSISAPGNCSRVSLPMPLGELRDTVTAPAASTPQARKFDVPQSTATQSTLSVTGKLTIHAPTTARRSWRKLALGQGFSQPQSCRSQSCLYRRAGLLRPLVW